MVQKGCFRIQWILRFVYGMDEKHDGKKYRYVWECPRTNIHIVVIYAIT